MSDGPLWKASAMSWVCGLCCPAMSLLIVLLFVGAVLAFRAGRRHQAFTQARADAADSRTKFFGAWRGQWSAGSEALTAWLLLLVCLVLAGVVAGR